MHEDKNSQFLHLGPERIVLRRERYFAAGMTGDADAFESELFDRFLQLFRGHFRMLQRDGRETSETIGMRRTPLGELLILNIDDAPSEAPVCSVPPPALMAQHLNIDSRIINDPQAFRTEHQRTRLLPATRTDVIGHESGERRVLDDIQFLGKNKV